MSQQVHVKYPYGRISALEEFFKVIQEDGDWNPSVVNETTLKTLGIAPSKEGLAIHSLQFLGILNENEEPTDIFRNLRQDFQLTLGRQVKEAYKAIFDQIPVGRINQETLVNFFKENGYNEDTAEYQGSLFVYLCKSAGINLPNAPVKFTRARFKKKKQQ